MQAGPTVESYASLCESRSHWMGLTPRKVSIGLQAKCMDHRSSCSNACSRETHNNSFCAISSHLWPRNGSSSKTAFQKSEVNSILALMYWESIQIRGFVIQQRASHSTGIFMTISSNEDLLLLWEATQMQWKDSGGQWTLDSCNMFFSRHMKYRGNESNANQV